MSEMGQKAKCSLRANVVRCCPECRHAATAAVCPFRANENRAESETLQLSQVLGNLDVENGRDFGGGF
jgi:hypothetical protein